MTLTLGLLAILHVAFLPGYLALRALGLHERAGAALLLAFPLSLVLNLLLAALLLAFGVFGQPALITVIAAELGALAWLAFRHPSGSFAARPESAAAPGAPAWDAVTTAAGMLIAAVMIVVFYKYFLAAATTVFTMNDPVLSWNRWAVDWLAGRPPDFSMNYPQLIPLTWATIYTVTGEPIQFFAKAVMPAFSLATVLMMAGLGARTRSADGLLGALVCAWLITTLHPAFIASGSVDLPVMMFAFAMFFALQLADLEKDRERALAWVWVALACCAGGAQVKQAGLFLLAPFVVLAPAVLRGKGWSGGELVRICATLFAALAVVVAPWYAYKHVQIMAGLERDIVPVVMQDIHEGRGYLARIRFSVSLLAADIHPALLGALAAATAVAFLRSRPARAAAAIGFAYVAVWMLWFSYDTRNLALAYPFIGLASVAGALAVARVARRRLPGSGGPLPGLALGASRSLERAFAARAVRRIAGYCVLAAAGAAWLYLAVAFDHGRLLAAHDAALRRLGDAEVNRVLYAFHARSPFQGKILTNYRYLEFLPELNRHFEPWYKKRFDIPNRPLRNLPAFRSYLEEYPEVRYVLLAETFAAPGVRKDIRQAIDEGISRGEYRVLLQSPKVFLVEMARPHPAAARGPGVSAREPSAASGKSAR